MKATIAVSAFLLSLAASAQQYKAPYAPGVKPPSTPQYQVPLAAPVVEGNLHSSLSGQDLQFMTDAIQAGLTEIEMGRVAKANGVSPAVKQFGQRLIDDHSLANRQIALVAARLAVTLPNEPDAAHQQHLTEMSSLRGPGFDDAFARHMVIGHEAALTVFRRQAKYGQSPDLRDFAEKTIPTLEEHLKIATELRDGKALSAL